MQQYQQQFLQYAINISALKFGSFTLKSGRKSPYFFNCGAFNTGDAISKLGDFYASAIIDNKLEFDCLFGPAYKGIPIVVATAIALKKHLNKNIPWCFNRKEVKQHGEGGIIVGADLSGKVLIIDDVITSGKAIKEAINIIKTSKSAKLSGCIVSLDRQEKSLNSEFSAIQQINSSYDIPVVSIVSLSDLINYSQKNDALNQYTPDIKNYMDKYSIF